MAANMKTDSILIKAEELHSRLGESRLKILHVHMAPIGSTKAESEKLFIPGARLFDLEAMSDQAQDLPHMALDPEVFAQRIRALDIDAEDEIVVYDEKGIYSSPRARYLFLNAGHSKIRVLNGGLPAWIGSGYDTSPMATEPKKTGSFTASAPLRGFVERAEVLETIQKKSVVLIDARSKDRFEGLVDEPRAGLRRGHIPTAFSIPFSSVLDGNFMKSAESLSELFLDRVNPEQKIITYCGSGVTACIVALALEVAGLGPARIYDGSWSEWGA